MAFIYVITNQLNGKQYVGKTLDTVEKRFKQHCRDSRKEKCEKRPLYLAMNKYGIENFAIETLEECQPEQINDKEVYWINKLDTYNNGYNATIGGDGKAYIDNRQILSLWNEGHCEKEISSIMNINEQTVRKYLYNANISSEEISKRALQLQSISIVQIDKDTDEILNIFPSIRSVDRFFNKRISSHIVEVLKGRRKTAYGYKWKYLSDIE